MAACCTPGQGLQDISQSQSSVESWLSSGGGQGLVENHCSLSPTHRVQAFCYHMCTEGAAWGAPRSPTHGRPGLQLWIHIVPVQSKWWGLVSGAFHYLSPAVFAQH